jgi:hypothetical protein
VRQNSLFPSAVPHTLLLDDSAARIARELWGRRRSFSLSLLIHLGSPSSCTTWRMNNKPVGGRNSETGVSPIDIIIRYMVMFSCPSNLPLTLPSSHLYTRLLLLVWDMAPCRLECDMSGLHTETVHEISGSHGGEYEISSFLGYSAV